jgi:asparagine synthase (glutamine-hydrolysing)
MAGILPDPVLRERRKGLQAVDWHVGSTAVHGEIAAEIERLERSHLASDALDLPRLRRLVENWRSGGWHRAEISVAYGAALARGIATGRFIRQVEGGEA